MRRWYVLGDTTDKGLRIFALDRFEGLALSKQKLKMPGDFSAEAYFADYCGVLTDSSVPKAHVVIRTYHKAVDFIRTLPLHHSQQTITATKDYSLGDIIASGTDTAWA